MKKKYFKNITNLKELKRQYRLLSKQYHPDNKETGDKKIFQEIQEQYYDFLDNNTIVEKYRVNISEEQALKGTTIDVGKYTLKIPPNYNGKPIIIKDKEPKSCKTELRVEVCVYPNVLYLTFLENVIRKAKKADDKTKNEIIEKCLGTLWNIWFRDDSKMAYNEIVETDYRLKSKFYRRKNK